MQILKDIISQYISLQPANHKGWQATQCKVCNDHTRKGLRGAFLFDTDKTVYKCWNCGCVATYDPDEHEYMPQSMIKVLTAFNIPDDAWQPLILTSKAYMFGCKKQSTAEAGYRNIEPKELPLPDFFYFLRDAALDDDMANCAKEYLISERGIDPCDYPFMLARKHKNPRLHKWLGRIIIPIYKNKKLIYYIGRALYDAERKYETPASPKEKILYGFDTIFDNSKTPILIVEGWFDAYAIDGVATLGNIITPAQEQWLNRSNREKIYIPDRFGDGMRAAETALKNGWHISTPDIGSNCKDMSDAVKKYGKMYVLKSIMDNNAIGFEAETQLKNYCID